MTMERNIKPLKTLPPTQYAFVSLASLRADPAQSSELRERVPRRPQLHPNLDHISPKSNFLVTS